MITLTILIIPPIRPRIPTGVLIDLEKASLPPPKILILQIQHRIKRDVYSRRKPGNMDQKPAYKWLVLLIRRMYTSGGKGTDNKARTESFLFCYSLSTKILKLREVKKEKKRKEKEAERGEEGAGKWQK